MKIRHVALAFVLAFALGAIAAVHLTQRSAAVVPAEVGAAAKAQSAPSAKDVPDDDGSDAQDAGTADWPAEAGSAEQVMYAQAQLMDAAIAKLAARTPDKTNLYLVAFAGDGEENVFRNEVEYVEKLFQERYAAIGHTLVLVNNPNTLTQRPIASLSNLQAAVDAVAAKMDPAQDVLLLFLTTHGSPDHELEVSLDPLPLDQIAPDDLADVFADSAIRNKVVVISACYSGGFIDALKGPSTMVITAARADRASFGCGTQSAITYFGRAFFANGLNDTDSFPAAFAEARKLIDTWETKAGEQHSEPQIATTRQIESRLKSWRDGIHLGPPVPFEAPASRDTPSPAAPNLTARN